MYFYENYIHIHIIAMKRIANETNDERCNKVEKLNLIAFNQTLHDHFEGFVTVDDIPNWDTCVLWKNTLKKCPIPSNLNCDICKHLMFDVSLRGIPIVNREWFENKKECMAERQIRHRYPDIFYDSFKKYYRNSEINLRLIKRSDILKTLLLNFRGYEPSNLQSKDYVKIIQYEFPQEFCDNNDSFASWIHFKKGYDNFAKELITEKDNPNYYCTGCGTRCKLNSTVNNQYQVCQNDICYFYHKQGSDWARLTPFEKNYKK